MSGTFSVTVQEARGKVAVSAELSKLVCVVGCSTAGSGLSAFYLNEKTAQAAIGYGDAVDTLCQVIKQQQPNGDVAKVPACFLDVDVGTDGAYRTIDVSGVTGTAVAAVDSSSKPVGTYQGYVLITTGGLVGTAGIKYRDSLDNGRHLSKIKALGTATSITIPNSGIKFDLSPASADLTALNTLINEEYTDFNAHVILTDGGVHGSADSADVVSIASASDTATRVARINALRAAYELHRIKTAGPVHGAADTTHAITAPVATDDSSALMLALDFKAKYNLHIATTAGAVHGAADSTNGTTAAAPSAGALVAGDIIRVQTDGPLPDAADVVTQVAILAKSGVDVGVLAFDFDCDATMAASISTAVSSMWSMGKRCGALCKTALPTAGQTEAQWAAAIQSNFASFTDSRISVISQYGLVTDAFTGRQYFRNKLQQIAADVARVEKGTWPNCPADRPTANFTLVDENGDDVGHDEGPRGACTGNSDDSQGNRFWDGQRLPDNKRREEVFSTVPWVMYAEDERIRNWMTRQIANAAERAAVSAANSGLGGKVFYIPADPTTGTPAVLTEASRLAVQGVIFEAVSKVVQGDVLNANDASVDTGLVQINPRITVTGGNLVGIECTLNLNVAGYVISLAITLAIQE